MVAACATPETPAPLVGVSAEARVLIDSLIVDEARAADRYARVVSRFGVVAPFAELGQASQRRLEALHGVVVRGGWSAPDPFAGLIGVEVYADIAGACDVAARFSRRTIERYERLLTRALPPEVRAVVRDNRDAVSGTDLERTTACR